MQVRSITSTGKYSQTQRCLLQNCLLRHCETKKISWKNRDTALCIKFFDATTFQKHQSVPLRNFSVLWDKKMKLFHTPFYGLIKFSCATHGQRPLWAALSLLRVIVSIFEMLKLKRKSWSSIKLIMSRMFALFMEFPNIFSGLLWAIFGSKVVLQKGPNIYTLKIELVHELFFSRDISSERAAGLPSKIPHWDFDPSKSEVIPATAAIVTSKEKREMSNVAKIPNSASPSPRSPPPVLKSKSDVIAKVTEVEQVTDLEQEDQSNA